MSGWENVAQYDGVSIAITGILVVFAVLSVISGFIALLPRLLARLNTVLPESPERHGTSQAAASGNVESQDAAVAAAIGYAMYLKSGGGSSVN